MFVPSHELCIGQYISHDTTISSRGLMILQLSVRNSLTQHRSLLTHRTHILLAKLGYPYDALCFQDMGITDSHH